MAKKNEESAPELVDSKDILSSILKDKDNKDKHFNYEKDHFYKVSSGSLNFDTLVGMITPGAHRLVGIPESGKTSFALEVARDFVRSPNRKVLYVKAEGRLSDELRARTGLLFVLDPKEWEDGSIFVLESNIYEFVINTIKGIVRNNPKETEFLIIVDSTDGLITQGDAHKNFDENTKVAGTPLLTKRFLQAMNLELTKKGHIALMLSQHTSTIKLNQYQPNDGNETVSGGGGGGWGILHFASLCLEFKARYGKDIFTLSSDKNKIIGHNVKVKVTKSVNEKTGVIVEYPVKYGAIGKSSVWVEKEIVNVLIEYQNLKQKGAWFTLDEDIVKELSDNGFETKGQFHGEEGMLKWLEETPEATRYLYNSLRARLT